MRWHGVYVQGNSVDGKTEHPQERCEFPDSTKLHDVIEMYTRAYGVCSSITIVCVSHTTGGESGANERS
jgi:hypothetical protein